jgi:hypothetical protein
LKTNPRFAHRHKFVIPAKAGIRGMAKITSLSGEIWIPAFAGMTENV